MVQKKFCLYLQVHAALHEKMNAAAEDEAELRGNHSIIFIGEDCFFNRNSRSNVSCGS
jgi:hypothetical protein